jgi:hypothetical protein
VITTLDHHGATIVYNLIKNKNSCIYRSSYNNDICRSSYFSYNILHKSFIYTDDKIWDKFWILWVNISLSEPTQHIINTFIYTDDRIWDKFWWQNLRQILVLRVNIVCPNPHKYPCLEYNFPFLKSQQFQTKYLQPIK